MGSFLMLSRKKRRQLTNFLKRLRVNRTQPRHLELIVAMKNGRNLNIQEQTNEVFLREIQKRTLSIVLIKSLIPYEITRFRDGHILNGVFYKGGEVKE